jgi:chemotaxis methyl-accepting protein methylase
LIQNKNPSLLVHVFFNHLTCNHAAVFQYADELPTLAKKISQEKQGRKKRGKPVLSDQTNISYAKWLKNKQG